MGRGERILHVGRASTMAVRWNSMRASRPIRTLAPNSDSRMKATPDKPPTMLFVALCRAAACVILLATGASAHAQQWPTRAIRVVSPFPAGSASDSVSRVVVDELSRLLGQP